MILILLLLCKTEKGKIPLACGVENFAIDRNNVLESSQLHFVIMLRSLIQ